VATKIQNPKGSKPQHTCDTCGPLKYPSTDSEFRDRKNALKSNRDPNLSNRDGTRFEGAAAEHNESDILRQEGRLNSKKKPDEDRKSAVSGAGNDEKIQFTCSICGEVQDGDVDHVGQDRDGHTKAVECKNGENFNPALDQDQTDRNIRQMTRLRDMAQAQGMSVVYKVPATHTEAAAQIQSTAQQLGFTVSVVGV
jgi:hypothetical protein